MKNNRQPDCFCEDELNCMTLIAGKDATASGFVMVGHNEDDKGSYCVRHSWVPARNWPEGTVLPAEEGLAAVPQVPHTYGYWWTEVKNPLGGISTADTFLNECGVCIVSNSMAGSREDKEDMSVVTDGGILYNLRRCLAERASSARDGARLLMELIDAYGYAQPGRAYTIADRNEAFMFQLVRGRHYVGARVPDDAVVVMPNHYTFDTLQDCPEMFYPADIVSYAQKKRWYTPKTPGDTSDFSFCRAYQSPSSWRKTHNTYRQRYAQYRLFGMDPAVPVFPFCVRTQKKFRPSEFCDVLAGHNDGICAPYTGFGPGLSVHEATEFTPICRMTTIDSQVFEFTQEIRDTVVHSCYGRPCTVPYAPLQPLRNPKAGAVYNSTAEERMRTHLLPEQDSFSGYGSKEYCLRHNETLAELTRCATGKAISRMIARSRQATDRFTAEGNYPADGGSRALDAVCRRLGTFGANNVPGVTVTPAAEALSLSDLPETLRIDFDCFGRPDPYTVCVGLAHRSARTEYSFLSAPESMRLLSPCRYTGEFTLKPFIDTVPGPGTYRIYLAGRDTGGAPFVGFYDLIIRE